MERAENKSKAKNLLKKFLKFIRESLDEMRNDDSEEALDPPVGEYLSAAQEDETSNEERTEGISDSIHEIKSRVVDVKAPAADGHDEEQDTQQEDEQGETAISDIPGEGGSGDQDSHGGGEGGGHHPGDGSGDIPVEHRKSPSVIAAHHVRNLVRDRKSGAYTVLFTPAVSASDGVLEVLMSAESQNYPARLLAVRCASQPNLVLVGNKIQNVVFTKQQPLRIDIQIDYHDFCSMEVKAYGNKI